MSKSHEGFVDAAEYGFSPDAGSAESTKALQAAVDQGGTIQVSRPGTSMMSNPSATAQGPVDMELKIKNTTITIHAKAPKGVNLQFVPNESIERFDIVFEDVNHETSLRRGTA